MARISLLLADAHSLKDKRIVVRRIKDRVRERVGVFVSEVGAPEIKDSWNRGELGVALASSDRQKALALIDEVVRVAMSAGGAEITAIAKDVITFGDLPGALGAEASAAGPRAPGGPVAIDRDTGDRTGSADK